LLSDNPINLPNLVGSPESFDAVALPQQPEQALVVWAAAGNLQAQRFSPSGVPAEEAWEVANIAAGTVRVANLPNQGTVIAWDAPDADGNGVWVQRLDSGDIPLESAFVAHGSQTGDQRLSDLAVFSDGGFVLLFTDDFGDGDGTCAKAQLFAPSGFPLNTDLVLNTTPEGDQEARSVLVLDTDEWVATFATTEDFSGHPAYTRRFFQSGEPSMGQPEIRGSAQVTGNQSAPAAARSGERVLLVYTSPHENDPDGGILGRVFTPDGHQVRAEALINSQTAGALSEPSVAGGPDRFLITWTAAEAEGEDGDVVGTWLNAEGTPLGVGDIPIGTVTAGHQGQSAVAVTANGNYLVLFEGDSGNVDAATDILARAFDADGVSESIETVIHSVTAGIQTAPSVVADNDTFLAVYQSQDAAGTGTDTGEDILLQRLTLSGVPSGDPVIVNNASSGDQTRPTISVSDDGTQITVCWLTVEAGVTMRELHCRHLNEDLQGFGSFPVSSPTVPAGTLVTPWPVHPTLARLDDGTLLLGWAEQSHASQQDIAVAVLTENKAPQTRIVANRTRPQNQDHPFLLATGGSTFWAGWESPGQDGDGSGVYFRTLPKPPLAP
jgi:hypothetical protein